MNEAFKPVWAEILTLQTSHGSRSWEPAHNEFSGTVAEVVAEIERRNEYWKKEELKRRAKLGTNPA